MTKKFKIAIDMFVIGLDWYNVEWTLRSWFIQLWYALWIHPTSSRYIFIHKYRVKEKSVKIQLRFYLQWML